MGKVIKVKYLSRMRPKFWFKNFRVAQSNVLSIWKSFLKSYPIINQAIYWPIGHGIQLNIGIDPIVGIHEYYKLSRIQVAELHSKNIVVLKQAWCGGCHDNDRWLTAQDLNLNDHLVEEWNG